MATYPLRVCKTGMILALPRKAFSEEELEEAKNNPEEELLGPSQVVTTSIKGSTDFEAELAVVLVEFNMSVRSQLAKRTRKMTKAVIGFAEDLDSLPDLKELEEICATWLESGLVRNENFITANEDGLPLEEGSVAHEISNFRELMEERMALLEAQVISVKSQQQHTGPVSNAGRGASPKTQARSAGPSSTLGGGYGRDVQARGRAMMQVLDGAQPQAHIPRPPTRMPDEPHKATMSAPDVQDDHDENDAGCDGQEEQEEEPKATWSSRYRGFGKQWRGGRRGMVLQFKRRKRDRGGGETEIGHEGPPRGLSRENGAEDDESNRGFRNGPFSASPVCSQHASGKKPNSRLLCVGTGRSSQAVAGKQTSPSSVAGHQDAGRNGAIPHRRVVGPWGHWATQDLQALRKQYIYTRLVEATWVASLINQLKEEDWLVKKRNSFKQAPNKKGDGKGSGETARE